MKENEQFIIEISDSLRISADRIFCAIGASKPIVPDIKGLNAETCTFYEYFDPNTAAERYKNKIVVVLGRGNSAFEITHHLIDITAETGVVTRSLPQFARQTHNVHDVRAQVSDVFDLMQLKSNNNIVSDRIVEINRITSGKHKRRLLVSYETPCPHWEPPRWMKRKGIIDGVIVCCGFNYTLSDIFDQKTVRPEVDKKDKFCLFTSSWESVNILGLYFIGAPMRVNDPDAASGFVHGFRGNIQALGHIIAEKYHGRAIKPIFECKISLTNPSDGLTALPEFLVEFVSTTMSLFELFGYLGSTITFETKNDDKGSVYAGV